MNNFLETAIKYAEMGYNVFPCLENTKIPATPNGCLDATDDVEMIKAKWSSPRYEKCNIGVACFNLLVLDVDVKNGNGFEDLTKLFELESFDQTLTNVITTTSGGRHFYFKRPQEKIVGRKRFPINGEPTQLDCQVGNQYVMAPPSVINGSEYVCNDKEFLPVDLLPELPSRWLAVFPKPREETPAAVVSPPVYIETNLTVNDKIRACSKYAETIDIAKEGHGGQTAFWNACLKIFNGFDLTYEEGLPIVYQYNQRCDPPWNLGKKKDAEWFYYTVNKAANYRDERRGCLAQYNQANAIGISYEDCLKAIGNSFTEKFAKPKPTKEELAVLDKVVEEESAEINEPTQTDTRGVIESKFLEAPGFLDLYCKTLRDHSVFYSQSLASAGGFALLSTLMGPKFTLHGLYENVYIFALAGSGQGKDAPRKMNKMILEKVGLFDAERRTFASGEAIEDELIRFPIKLFQIDEVDFLLKSISSGKEQHQRTMQANLLEFYSSAGDTIHARSRATSMNKGKGRNDDVIRNLYLNIFGVCPPDDYYQQLSQRVIEGGLFGRFIVLRSAESEANFSNTGLTDDNIPQDLVRMAEFFTYFTNSENGADQSLLGFGTQAPYKIPMTDSAKMQLENFHRKMTMKAREAGQAEYRCAVYARTGEKAYKFAAIHAASKLAPTLINFRNPDTNTYDMKRINETFCVDVESATWAIDLIETVIEKQLDELDRYRYSTIYEKNCNQVLDAVQHATITTKRQGITWITLLRRFRQFESKELGKYVQDLIERREIQKVFKPGTSGKDVEVFEAIFKNIP